MTCDRSDVTLENNLAWNIYCLGKWKGRTKFSIGNATYVESALNFRNSLFIKVYVFERIQITLTFFYIQNTRFFFSFYLCLYYWRYHTRVFNVKWNWFLFHVHARKFKLHFKVYDWFKHITRILLPYLVPLSLQWASCIFKQGQWGTVPPSINSLDVASSLRMTTDIIRTSRIFPFLFHASFILH